MLVPFIARARCCRHLRRVPLSRDVGLHLGTDDGHAPRDDAYVREAVLDEHRRKMRVDVNARRRVKPLEGDGVPHVLAQRERAARLEFDRVVRAILGALVRRPD